MRVRLGHVGDGERGYAREGHLPWMDCRGEGVLVVVDRKNFPDDVPVTLKPERVGHDWCGPRNDGSTEHSTRQRGRAEEIPKYV